MDLVEDAQCAIAASAFLIQVRRANKLPRLEVWQTLATQGETWVSFKTLSKSPAGASNGPIGQVQKN